MTYLEKLPVRGDAPWEPVPADKIVAGTPQTRTWVHYDNPGGKLSTGEWEATEGKWCIAYGEWEYVLVISGRCVIIGDDGASETKRSSRFCGSLWCKGNESATSAIATEATR